VVRSPRWSRDEVVLALALYFEHRGDYLPPSSKKIEELSEVLNSMGSGVGVEKYRNPNGVAMKLMNFRSLDPMYVQAGAKGLSGASKLDKEIWNEFFGKEAELLRIAGEFRRSIGL
jgi:5-methylcytosine-specific restriction protein A